MSHIVLFQASIKRQFSSLHHWLLLPISENISTSNNNGDGLALNNEPLITALEPLDLPLDSHVTVARPGPDEVLLQDVYRLVTGQSLTVTPPRNWRQMESFPAGPRRDNYGGIVFDTVTVVSIVVIITIIIIIIIIIIVTTIITNETSSLNLFRRILF
jgi:hypothetical protein